MVHQLRFIKYIAYLQVIGIIFVVFGHSFHEYPNEGKDLLIYRMMYSFRMPLFMFVSGFLMVYTTHIRSQKISFVNFFKKKVIRLLVPFVFLSAITFVPRAVMSNMADDVISITFESFWHSFFYSDSLVIPYYWFLQSSFTLLIFSYAVNSVLSKLNINDVLIYTTLLLLSFTLKFLPIEFGTFFSISSTVNIAPYFFLGAIYCLSFNKLDIFIPWTSIFTLLFTGITWVILFIVTEGTPSIVVCSIFGIAMNISVAKILEKYHMNILDNLIGANYSIFLLSWYINVLTQQILHHFVELPLWLYSFLSFSLGIYIPFLLYQYLQENADKTLVKVTAFLLGQSLKKSTKPHSDLINK